MKTILFSTIILLAAVQLVGQHPSFQLPKVWDETVVISLAYTGSMSGAESHFTFTYDSCNYQVTSLHTKEEKKSFLLSAKDREMILAKLRGLKIENIKPEMRLVPQHDGWSTLLCAGTLCIEGGSASVMSDEDKNRFLDACRYLEAFAMNRK